MIARTRFITSSFLLQQVIEETCILSRRGFLLLQVTEGLSVHAHVSLVCQAEVDGIETRDICIPCLYPIYSPKACGVEACYS